MIANFAYKINYFFYWELMIDFSIIVQFIISLSKMIELKSYLHWFLFHTFIISTKLLNYKIHPHKNNIKSKYEQSFIVKKGTIKKQSNMILIDCPLIITLKSPKFLKMVIGWKNFELILNWFSLPFYKGYLGLYFWFFKILMAVV